MKECYEIQNGRLIICDPELGIAIDEPFDLTPHCTSDESTQLHSSCYYLDGLLHGPSRYFIKEQQLSVSWYYRGKRHGKMLQHYPSGALSSIQSFFDGLRIGTHVYYYGDGKVRTEMSYVKGVLDGEMKLYWPNGQLKRLVIFQAGKKIGIEKFYSDAGVVTEEIVHAS